MGQPALLTGQGAAAAEVSRAGMAAAIPTAADITRILLELDKTLLDVHSLTALGRAAVQILGTIPGVSAVWLWRPDGTGRLRHEAANGSGAEDYANAVVVRIDSGPLAQGPAGRAWRTGTITGIDDWSSDPIAEPWRNVALRHPWRSSVAVPLRGRAGMHRIVDLRSVVPNFFSREPIHSFLEHISTMLGMALERVETADAERRRLARIEHIQRLYAALFGEAQLLLKAQTEVEVLRGTCRRLVTGGLFVATWIGRPDAEGRCSYYTGAGRGVSLIRRFYSQLDADEPRSLLGRAWASGRTQFDNDRLADPAVSELSADMERHQWRAAATVPIRRGGERWGVLAAVSAQTDVFDQEMLHLLARVGEMIGRALDERDLKETLNQERTALSWTARHDTLTELPNRLALSEHLPQAMSRARRQERLLAVGMLDLDDFKPVNDRFGHAAGDHLLREIAARLRHALRGTDFVARLGGDEFAIVLEGLAQMADLESAAERIHAAITAPVALPNGTSVNVGGSLGVTMFPLDNVESDLLLRHADAALYAAKENKRNRERFWELYRPSQEKGVETVLLRGLLARGQVRVHYQPIIDLQRGVVVGVEALARLAKGSRLVSPGEFLPHLSAPERRKLTQQVLERGLEDLALWDRAGHRLGLSVNVDPEAVLNADCRTCLDDVLGASSVEPGRITLEVLESGEFLSLDHALERIDDIRAVGVRIALDDVGSAYSSLLRLKALPVDTIKLDQAFVREVHRRPDDLLFVMTLQALARGLGTGLVVEGAETDDILDALAVLGVEQVQGYAVARPMPADALLTWLAGFTPPPVVRQPRSLLGVFAAHLDLQHVLTLLPSHTMVSLDLHDEQASPTGQFLAAAGLCATPAGQAHARFFAALRRWSQDGTPWNAAGEAFRAALLDAITANQRTPG